MLQQKFGLNVHGLNYSNHQKLQRYVDIKKPVAMLSMNNPTLAETFARSDVPCPIYRHRFQADEHIHELARSGYEWWNTTKNEIQWLLGHPLDRRVIVNVGNELNGNYSKINKVLLEAAEAMADDGYSGVFGNFAVGTPEAYHWQNELQPLAYELAGQYRDIHYIGVHEYMMQHPFLGVAGYGWNGMTVVDGMPSVPMNRRAKYIIGRYENIFTAIPNGTRPRILITEFGADYVPALAQQFGFSQNMRGYKTQFTSQQHMMQMYALAATTFYTDPAIKGLTIFSYGDSGGWDTYNVESADWFLDNAEQLQVEAPKREAMNEVEIRADGVVNIRSGPSTTYADIGDVPNAWTRVLELNTARQGSYTWKEYRFSENFSGWVREDVVQTRPYTPTNTEPVYIQLPGFEVNISSYTPEQRKDMATVIRGVANALIYFADEVEE